MTATTCSALGCNEATNPLRSMSGGFLCRGCWSRLPSFLKQAFANRRLHGGSTADLQRAAIRQLATGEANRRSRR